MSLTTKVKIGDFLSETQYYKVISEKQVTGTSVYTLENERGLKIDVSKDVIDEGMCSSINYENELKLSATELEEVFKNAGSTIFTVTYYKQLRPEDLLDKIKSIKDTTTLSKTDVKDWTNGEVRELTGYRTSDANFGRSNVVDLSVKLDTTKNYDNRKRLVDHRTIISLILRGIKYSLK